MPRLNSQVRRLNLALACPLEAPHTKVRGIKLTTFVGATERLSSRLMLATLACVASFSTTPAGSHRGRAQPRGAASCCEVDLDQVVRQTPPVTLAYLGDAVWEVEVRKRLLWPPRRLNDLNRAVVIKTCAEGQCVGMHVQDAPSHEPRATPTL